jgi:hypothetical protein
MAGKSPVSNETKLLDAISSLKRAIGVPDHPQRIDHFRPIGAKIYTNDANSSEILGALFHQFLHGDKIVYTKDKDGKGIPLPFNQQCGESENSDVYYIELSMSDAKKRVFVERLNKYIQKILEPTRRDLNDSANKSGRVSRAESGTSKSR